jgi:hypothetical protein
MTTAPYSRASIVTAFASSFVRVVRFGAASCTSADVVAFILSSLPHLLIVLATSFCCYICTGTIGKFSIPALLVALVSSVTLLAIAKVVVEFLAFQVLPLRAIYRQYRLITVRTFERFDCR